ncbi:MAG: hypothetical protein BK997_02360 [Candidatus Micrarchaeum sp. ARMAN-1]|jgi:hypothetical protein|nr:hypothetical protein [Candidatus Marsarchaeota archaeon]OJI07698.1 MAG: hypothetical protein BK997_02360 [Candidatus Micrarchaeum sp. ARMAN-1]
MPNEINFMDVTVLKRIKPDTTVEKFGGLINSSFFDASNALGTLKLKGLVDFTTYVPGQNSITVTEIGKKLLEEADTKEKMPFDQLDLAILTQLSAGKRNLADLSTAVNINSKDLAMHLYKLGEQQYISVDIRNGSLDMSLTEKGFMQSKAGMPQQQVPQTPAQGTQQIQNVHAQTTAMQQPAATPSQTPQNASTQTTPTKPNPGAQPAAAAPASNAQQAQNTQAAQEMQHPPEDKEIAEMQKQLSQNTQKKSNKMLYAAAAIIIIIILLALFAKGVL